MKKGKKFDICLKGLTDKMISFDVTRYNRSYEVIYTDKGDGPLECTVVVTEPYDRETLESDINLINDIVPLFAETALKMALDLFETKFPIKFPILNK